MKTEHGHTASSGYFRTPTYNSWRKMKERCLNPNQADYENYGGKGIKIDDKWLGYDGFTNFLTDMGEKPVGTSIDRINPDGDYSPTNCKWSNAKEQARNKRKKI